MIELDDRVRQLLDARAWKGLKQELQVLDPVQLSEIIGNFQEQERIVLFRLVPHDLATDTFQLLSPGDQEAIIEELAANARKLAALLNDLDPDDRTALFEELPGQVSQRLMQMLSAEERQIATHLLGYPEDSIGRLMTPEFVAVRPQYTIHKTLEHIRRFGQDSETLDVIYVVDDHWKLVDELRIKEILLASPEQSIAELCDGRFVALSVDADQEVAVKTFRDYDRVALPVTDTDGTLLGIVTVDDVMDVVEEEHTEDFHKFGGTEELDVSYTRTPLLEMVKKRAGWLVILFLGEMLTASAMGYFDDAISKAVVLALFLPLIISSGGNSGSQAASLIIRSLALDELKVKNWWYVLRKELLSGLLLGATLGVIGFVRIVIWQQCGLYDYGEHWPWIGLCIAISLICIVMWGTLSGSMVPLLLKRIGLDPATASAPFVATLVDVTGVVIYFSVAALLLSGKLL
jgi:magnesium transporter